MLDELEFEPGTLLEVTVDDISLWSTRYPSGVLGGGGTYLCKGMRALVLANLSSPRGGELLLLFDDRSAWAPAEIAARRTTLVNFPGGRR